jgi:hypothetical protein
MNSDFLQTRHGTVVGHCVMAMGGRFQARIPWGGVASPNLSPLFFSGIRRVSSVDLLC